VIGPVFSDRTFDQLKQLAVEARDGLNQYDDKFVRYEHHNLSPLVEVHRTLVEPASELFGVRLKPSYVFLANYLVGGICPLHVDRPQCFRTIDLFVGSDDDSGWPIRIGEPWTDDQWDNYDGARYIGPVEPGTEPELDVVWHDIVLQPNEAVCYSGTHSWHYRPTAATVRNDLIFFHFVSEDFNGELV